MGAKVDVALGTYQKIQRGSILKGWWTDESDVVIKKAILTDKVRFHIETKNIPDGDKVNLDIYDHDGAFNPDDFIAPFEIVVNGNKGLATVELKESWISFIDDDHGKEIELYCKGKYADDEKDLPDDTDDYLIVYEKGEIVTVIIELPHTGHTDKLNRKGLAGHTGIIIGSEFYDFGPQPGHPFYSDGRGWWDEFYTDLKKSDILQILNNDYKDPSNPSDVMNRESYGITGEVYLIDICIRKKELNELKKWWDERYSDMGTYSVIPLIGDQCTTTVRISLEKSTDIFSTFTITKTTQTPKGFLDLLTGKAKHTAGRNADELVTTVKTYPQL